ncbi:MAG: hypothetical protein GC199_05520 [Alphaproteobacteria bacterium]|nr:hypothetical protein [Alphaproteobacteria bacterium]
MPVLSPQAGRPAIRLEAAPREPIASVSHDPRSHESRRDEAAHPDRPPDPAAARHAANERRRAAALRLAALSRPERERGGEKEAAPPPHRDPPPRESPQHPPVAHAPPPSLYEKPRALPWPAARADRDWALVSLLLVDFAEANLRRDFEMTRALLTAGDLTEALSRHDAYMAETERAFAEQAVELRELAARLAAR